MARTAFLSGGDVASAPRRWCEMLLDRRSEREVLGRLPEVADEAPLVCLVDDAQWLDRASVQALEFVARRLFAESVAFVFGVRQSGAEQPLGGLPELVVEGLHNGDARALLSSVIR